MSTNYQKPDWDEYFFGIMDAVAKRSSCDRGRVGCVFVRDKRVLSTGYAGSPSGEPECDEVGHEMVTIHRPLRKDETPENTLGYNPETWMVESQHCIRTIHAEQNAIVYAAKKGIALEGSTLYVSMTPCEVCARLLLGIGVKRVVARNRYHTDKKTVELFERHGIILDIVNNETTY